MSGICGVVTSETPNQVAGIAGLMADGISLSKADRVAQRSERGVALAVSARFATQQLFENAQALVACDAELYNQDELGRLIADGGSLPNGSETAALIARLYERFGADFVRRLEGAFSVLLWDRRERKLLAAIDGFGIKRLVYHQERGTLMIGSRINGLRASGRVDIEVNPRAIANVLNFSSNLGPETVLRKVQRLLPGTLMITSGEQIQLQRYWNLRYGSVGRTSEDRLSQELEAVVERSVATHASGESFGALGAFLSGGTDSSTVVGMMSRLGRGTPNSFSIGFQEQPFNELGYAEIAARKFRSKHHTYLVGADDCFNALPEMIRYFDEPFGNSSAIPTYFCARLAAENGVKVLLAGDGGDELFGGNERYATDKIFEFYSYVPQAFRKGIIEPVLKLPVNGVIDRARRYVGRANLAPIERYCCFQFLRTHAAEEIFERDFLKSLGGYSVLETPTRHYLEAPARDHLDRLLYVDMKITLADNDLPKVTCMSELAGISTRFPFLDRSVAEFAGRVPARLKVKGLEKRYLFKKAFRNLLPPEIIKKKKHGFGIPVATWMKTDPRMRELSHDVLLSSRTFERGYFKRQFIEGLFRKHDSEETTYYGDTLWTFLTVELWHRQAIDVVAKITV